MVEYDIQAISNNGFKDHEEAICGLPEFSGVMYQHVDTIGPNGPLDID